MAEGEYGTRGEARVASPSTRAQKRPFPFHVCIGVAGLTIAMAAVFALDVSLPIGFNAAYLYSIAVIGAGLWRKRWIVIAASPALVAPRTPAGSWDAPVSRIAWTRAR